ncbi:MAG TPA: ice-binding family protein, partial [Candidatus Methanoperedens sp.]|nr:ice-binding family protein [Candidatus Methanoperedens sp.]
MRYQIMEKDKIWTYISDILVILSDAVGKNMTGSARYLSILAIVGFTALVFSASPALAATAPTLGTAQSYGVLGHTTVTNTGPTVVNGDLGLSPGTAVTGFPPGIATGTIHTADAAALQAQNDVTTAYNNLAGQTCDFDPFGPTDLAGQTLVP